MNRIINVKPESLLKMNPLDLAEFLNCEIDLKVPSSIETREEKIQAIEMINKSIGYANYFKEMETIARIKKKESKRNHAPAVISEKYLGQEEVFEAYKKMSENTYEAISKIMTMKRLMLDDVKLLSNTP